MAGGLGNDTYIVDDAADAVTEVAGQGTDSVRASVSYTLAANVEALVLTGVASINGNRQHVGQHAHGQRRGQRAQRPHGAATRWRAVRATTPTSSTTRSTS
jgi:Ca2+-binding RTX toxin-like protein